MEISLIVMLAWLLSSWWVPERVVMNLGAVTKTDRSNIQIDEALLLNAALFGLPEEEVVQSQPVKQIVQSHLNIVLSGTMVAGDVSAAVVALNGRATQQVFFVGDDIQGGAILHKVEMDAIVVDRNGLLERIYCLRSLVKTMHFSARL